MDFIEIFNTLFSNPLINGIVALYKVLAFFELPYALGFAIILLTILIRIILYPLVSAQIKSAHKMQKVAPHMTRVRNMHKNDRKKQQEEMLKLYKEHGVNPAAGCLPMLIQLPVIWALYHVLITTVGARSFEAIEKINDTLYFPFLRLDTVWDTLFFGLPLADSPASIITSAPYIILLPVITGAFQFILSKMMLPEEVIEKASTSGEKEDFQTVFQKQSLFIFPIMIGFFSYTLPLGLSLYWNTYTVFGILQQYLLLGPGATRSWINRIKK